MLTWITHEFSSIHIVWFMLTCYKLDVDPFNLFLWSNVIVVFVFQISFAVTSLIKIYMPVFGWLISSNHNFFFYRYFQILFMEIMFHFAGEQSKGTNNDMEVRSFWSIVRPCSRLLQVAYSPGIFFYMVQYPHYDKAQWKW